MFSLHTVASKVNLKSHLGNVPSAGTFYKIENKQLNVSLEKEFVARYNQTMTETN